MLRKATIKYITEQDDFDFEYQSGVDVGGRGGVSFEAATAATRKPFFCLIYVILNDDDDINMYICIMCFLNDNNGICRRILCNKDKTL